MSDPRLAQPAASRWFAALVTLLALALAGYGGWQCVVEQRWLALPFDVGLPIAIWIEWRVLRRRDEQARSAADPMMATALLLLAMLILDLP